MFLTFWYEEVVVLSRTSTYQLAKTLREQDWHTVKVWNCTLRCEIVLSSTDKTHVHSLLVTFDVL